MKVIKYPTLKETLYFEEMPNGLKVYLLPKVGFSKTYGLFSTRFGSVDTTFVPLHEQDMIKVPDGIAHFLEHKMFEMEDGDASEAFAKLGASTNAFTSSSRTAYLFSTTSHEKECIELLLDFVQDIYLTDENVEKEKGIINQEIGCMMMIQIGVVILEVFKIYISIILLKLTLQELWKQLLLLIKQH